MARRASAATSCSSGSHGIEQLAAKVGGEADHTRKRSVYLASRRKDVEALERERRARLEIGIEVDLLLPQRHPRAASPSTGPPRCSPDDASEIDPLRFTHALLAAAVADGVEVYDRTGVARYQSDRKGVLLETADGWRVRARKAMFATGYNIPPFVPRKPIHLNSTFAFATSPLESFDGWGEDRCLIWETARPYLYARTTPTAAPSWAARMCRSRGPQGGAEPGAADGPSGEGLRRASSPGSSFDVDWSWSGTFAQTADGLPFIGAPPGFPERVRRAGVRGQRDRVRPGGGEAARRTSSTDGTRRTPSCSGSGADGRASGSRILRARSAH